MKIQSCILLILVFNTYILCQSNSKFDLEIKAGPMFIGTGDLWIYSNSVKVNYKLNKSVGLFLEPAFAFGKNISENIIIQGQLLPRNSYHSSVKLNSGFNFKLLEISKISINLQPQFCIAKMLFVNQSTAYYLPFEQITQEEFRIAYLPPKIRNEYTVGGGIGIGSYYQISNNNLLGIGLTTQLFKNSSIDHNFFASFRIEF